MILSALVFSALMSAPQDAKPVTLSRVFTKGEKLQYDIKSNLHVETRPYQYTTFFPEDLDLNYKFTTEVRSLKGDGVAVIHYLRPNMVQVQGETFNTPSKTTVEKLDFNLDLTVSPINEILEQKDLNPPKKTPPKKDSGGGLNLKISRGYIQQNPLQAMLGEFIGKVYRLALNVGPIGSALDFSPKLPFDEVKVGDTWKKTVDYEPQQLSGKEGKQAVQRLDYTFTYKGPVTVNGKQFYRITATLDLNTDLASFINQMANAKPEDTGLKSVPLTLKQTIDYDLDMATKRTVLARSKAEGGFQVNITQVPEGPVQEEKLTGTTEMRLVAIGTATPAKPPVKHGGKTHR